jgi:transposase
LKPVIIFTLPDAIKQIADLQKKQVVLEGMLAQERLVYGRVTYETTAKNQVLQEEIIQINRELLQAHQMLADKDSLIASLQEELARINEQVEEGLAKGWQLDQLRDMLFGKRSEKFVPSPADTQVAIQQTLGADFDSQIVEAIVQEQVAAPLPSDTPTNRNKKRCLPQKIKRRPFARHLETVKTIVDYQGDKTGLKVFGKKVTVYYDFEPGKLIKKVEEHIQYISTDGKARIITPPVAPRIIERGQAGNALVAHMQTERFVYGMPYHRQLQRFERTLRFSFAPSTVNHWEQICFHKLKRLLKLLKKLIQQADYIKADETPLLYVNDIAKGKASRGWLWVFEAPGLKMILFEFSPSRGHQVPKELLKDFKGDLQTDGYSAYATAFRDNEFVQLTACLIHIRRGFKAAQRQHREGVQEVLTWFNIIYKLEKQARTQGLGDEGRLAMRLKYTKPFFEKIKQWLDEQKQRNLPPDSPIAGAVNYALNRWDKLQRFFEDGKIDLDTNSTENAIRPVTIFRKNSLFAGNEHGGERVALFYSLLETCKLNNIDPYQYLKDVYDRIHDCPAQGLIHLLPPYWKKGRLETHTPPDNI